MAHRGALRSISLLAATLAVISLAFLAGCSTGKRDGAALASEFETLRQALKKEAVTEEHDIVVAEVGKAKKATEAKDSAKLAESLKSAGKWALDVATKIGVSLATEAIKQPTGMK
jgi:hypothetical protein